MDGEASAVATARMLMLMLMPPPACPPLPLLLLWRSLAGEACGGEKERERGGVETRSGPGRGSGRGLDA